MKLKKILKDMDEKPSAAETILEKIKKKETEDKESREISEKFVEEFTKENGKIKYFRDQWFGTKVWCEAYDEGYEQGLWEAEEEHKEIIYKMVMNFYGRDKN